MRGRLEGALLVSYMAFSAFMVYTAMYGMRKPYTASSYDGLEQFGISYKVVLVTAQVLGYMLSKFIGIKVIAEMKAHQRPFFILLLVTTGWITLLGFAIVPFEYKFICMFLNGLPLGMIWGLVFGYLEGRKMTDFMGAFLSVSFIFSSGFAKTVGSWLLNSINVDQWWMPFMAGCVFMLPLLIFTYLLSKSPPPNDVDIEHRTARKPMEKDQRKHFLQQFGLLIVPAVITYAILTALRDFCEDFAAELWIETGHSGNALIFTNISTITSVIVIGVISLFFLIRNNFRAFVGIHILVVIGFSISLISTFLFQIGLIGTIFWMILATTGLYLGYVAKNCLYYERMLATYTINGNVGFVMYIADAFGYLGTIVVLIIKEYANWQIDWLDFFIKAFYFGGVVGIMLVYFTLRGFIKKYKTLTYGK